MLTSVCLVGMISAMTAAAGDSPQLAAPFAASLELTVIDAPDGAAGPLGGALVLAENPDVLLFIGAASTPDAVIQAAALLRDPSGAIVGFAGPATTIAAAPGSSSGGAATSFTDFTGDLLTYCASDAGFGQLDVGDSEPTYVQSLAEMFRDGLAAHAVAPCGFPGGERLVFLSDAGEWRGGGWFVQQGCGSGCVIVFAGRDVQATIDAGPRALVHVMGDTRGIPENVVFVTDDDGRVDGYAVDAAGDPIAASQFTLVQNAPGAAGLAVDPLTDDLIVTRGSGDFLVITGFTGCPPAELTGDGVVDASDLAVLLADWGPCPGCSECAGNLDCDCQTDADDLAMLLAAWGPCR